MAADGREYSGATEAIPAELMIWLSPIFPVGGFAYSQGLETAIWKGWVSDAETLGKWLSALCLHGALRNDLIVLGLIHSAPDEAEIENIAELAAALQPSKERAEEALIQGQAFMDAYCAAWQGTEYPKPMPSIEAPVTLPVAVGLAARAHKLSISPTLLAYGTAFQNNMVSAAIRLSVIGQFDGQRVLARVLPVLREACRFAMSAREDDLGSASFVADLAAIQHETQPVRLFRS